MNNFAYSRADDATSALDLISAANGNGGGKFLAGGTNLVDLMREGIERPSAVVDVTRLPLDSITEHNGGLRIGAMVRNSHLAANALVRQRYPLLSQAILAGASPQLRNMATTGGNLMQRTRCYYFYDLSTHCNKRVPGSGCDARNGFNRYHAILGTSEHCIATHPSDMCVALAALDATINVESNLGARSLPAEGFHRLPGDSPDHETNLEAGELIVSVDLPASTADLHSHYRKLRDRASYAFALVSVAAAVKIVSGKLEQIHIALGGVAHKPWRALVAENMLVDHIPSAKLFEQAAAAELASASPRRYNGFKIELARRTIVDVLSELTSESTKSQ